jgi:small subunit ribosomal protein S4
MEKSPILPGQHGADKKRNTEYCEQIREKQKVKRAYGLLEKQFRKYYEIADNMKGVTGETMLELLETRLDNVVYRLGIAASRKESRQLVNHGHICVNGKVVDIPSSQVALNDVISVKENSKDKEVFKQLKGAKVVTPKWLEFNTDTLSGKVIALPQRDDIDLPIREHLIVEFYSR